MQGIERRLSHSGPHIRAQPCRAQCRWSRRSLCPTLCFATAFAGRYASPAGSRTQERILRCACAADNTSRGVAAALHAPSIADNAHCQLGSFVLQRLTMQQHSCRYPDGRVRHIRYPAPSAELEQDSVDSLDAVDIALLYEDNWHPDRCGTLLRISCTVEHLLDQAVHQLRAQSRLASRAGMSLSGLGA